MNQKQDFLDAQNASILGVNTLNFLKMDFCKTCGILLVKKGISHACPKCGYTKGNVKIETKEKIPERTPVAIIKEENTVLPIVKAECPKCGHNQAYFWSSQTRGSDESETSFFKCTKCKHTRRQYT